jgi:hypothetical protein
MKKISTAAAKQTRNFQDQKLTIGLDLGDIGCKIEVGSAHLPS